MKTIRLKAAPRGFTLIELLVVIAIIAILAGLLLAAMPAIRGRATKKRAQAELQQVALAIEDYKAKLGYYPPDNRLSFSTNTLFYELVGCTRSGANVTPLDGSPTVSVVILNLAGSMGVMNASSGNSNSDEGKAAYNFLKQLKSTQYADAGGLRRLGVALDGVGMIGTGSSMITPFSYNSSNPTNNPNSFDLWVDIIVGGKTNRINNWSSNP